MAGEGNILECAAVDPGLPALRRAIGFARARHGLDAIKEAYCTANFGVSSETLARIEEGGIDPEPEIAAQIWLGLAGLSRRPYLAGDEPAPSQSHQSHALAGTLGQAAAGEGGCASPAAASPFDHFFLAPFHSGAGGKQWQIWFRDTGEQRRLTIEQARNLVAELAPLLDAYDLRFPRGNESAVA